MKDQILEALKNKYSNFGQSAEMLDGYAAYLAQSVNSAEGIEAAVAGLEPIFRLAQSEADKTRAKYKAEAERKERERSKENDGSDGSNGNGAPAWMQPFFEEFKAMKTEMNEWKARTRNETRRAAISNVVASLPDSLRNAYLSHPVDKLNDEGFNSLLADMKQDVEKWNKARMAQGGAFNPPYHNGGGAGGDVADDVIDKAIDEMFG